MDRITVIWIWMFHRFHKRGLINKRRFFCFYRNRLTLSIITLSLVAYQIRLFTYYLLLSNSWIIAKEIFVNNLMDQFRYVLQIFCFLDLDFSFLINHMERSHLFSIHLPHHKVRFKKHLWPKDFFCGGGEVECPRPRVFAHVQTREN